MLSLQSCPTLCYPMDCSPLGASVPGIPRQEHWSELPFLSPVDLPDPGIKARYPELQAYSLQSELPGRPTKYTAYLYIDITGYLHYHESNIQCIVYI